MEFTSETVRAEEDPSVLLLDHVTSGHPYVLSYVEQDLFDNELGWKVFLQIGNGVDSLDLAKTVLELALHSVKRALEQESEPTSE